MPCHWSGQDRDQDLYRVDIAGFEDFDSVIVNHAIGEVRPKPQWQLMVAIDLPPMPLFRNPTVVVRRRTGRSIAGEVLSSVKMPK